MDWPIIIAIISLIAAIIGLLYRIGFFRKIYDYSRERKVKDTIKVSFSPPEGKIRWENGYGLIKIIVVLGNSLPHKAFRNIRGKFWTDEQIYLSSTTLRPTKVARSVPYLYFNFNVDVLHKKTAMSLSTLTLKVPKKKGDYILGADLIAEELKDWRSFGYPLEVTDSKFKIHYESPKNKT